jgi:hypothetical protein
LRRICRFTCATVPTESCAGVGSATNAGVLVAVTALQAVE